METMSAPLIQLNKVDKFYRIWTHPRARLTGAVSRRMDATAWLPGLLRRLGARHHARVCREFYAVRNINLEVGRGETLGIIGKNGSGKSTILKIIAGTLQPSGGTVAVRGRVAAMLELTSGFEPDFTGLENVYMSASILGLSERETDARLDSILSFADIGDFVAQPVKTYSSGMLLRLAFAVHTAVEPEILIVDEALSVGDETFQRKCFARLERLKQEGTTLLFVSHDMSSVVSLTERAFFIHQGEIVMEGRPKRVVETYQRYCHAGREQAARLIAQIKAGEATAERNEAAAAEVGKAVEQSDCAVVDKAPQVEDAYSTRLRGEGYDPAFISMSRTRYDPYGGELYDLRLVNAAGEPVNILERRKTYYFEYKVKFSASCRDVTFAMLIKTLKGMELGGGRVLPWDRFIERVEAGDAYQVRYAFETLLMPGVYFLNAGVEGVVEGQRAYIHRILDALAFRVLTEELLMPTGIVDFRVEPQMEKITATKGSGDV